MSALPFTWALLVCLLINPGASRHLRSLGDQHGGSSRPVVGILSLPARTGTPFPYVREYAVEWLESGGVQVAAIDFNSSDLEAELSPLSGVLFTGGSLDADLRFGHPYVEAAFKVYQYALKRHEANDSLPIFGICQGHQLLAMLAAGDHRVIVEGAHTTDDVRLPLKITHPNSYMIGSLPKDVQNAMIERNVTPNIHRNSVPPNMWEVYKGLDDHFVITSTSQDPVNHMVFSASMESKPGRAPMYAVQFHPEMAPYAWIPEASEALFKDDDAMALSSAFSRFFGKVIRNTPRRPPIECGVGPVLIRNYKLRCDPEDRRLLIGTCVYEIIRKDLL